MRSISIKNLIRKSRNHRNAQAIQKLAQYDSLREWSISNTSPELPKYEAPPRIKLTAGAFNFIKSNIYQLRP